jgi:hypothetical protein
MQRPQPLQQSVNKTGFVRSRVVAMGRPRLSVQAVRQPVWRHSVLICAI